MSETSVDTSEAAAAAAAAATDERPAAEHEESLANGEEAPPAKQAAGSDASTIGNNEPRSEDDVVPHFNGEGGSKKPKEVEAPTEASGDEGESVGLNSLKAYGESSDDATEAVEPCGELAVEGEKAVKDDDAGAEHPSSDEKRGDEDSEVAVVQDEGGSTEAPVLEEVRTFGEISSEKEASNTRMEVDDEGTGSVEESGSREASTQPNLDGASVERTEVSNCSDEADKSESTGDNREMMDIQISSVSGAGDVDHHDEETASKTVGEEVEAEGESRASKKNDDDDDDVIEIIDDDNGVTEPQKKKPVLKLASFADMSANGNDAAQANVTGENPKKHNKVSGCAQCFKLSDSVLQNLVWETMRFCNVTCLGEYQNSMTKCSTCQHQVQESLIGKYCVRFGLDIKQFCSNVCLEDHKKGLKVCCYCQKDISGCDGFLAPIGDAGQFKDFCAQECLQKYEELHCGKMTEKAVAPCAVCSSKKPVEVRLLLKPKAEKPEDLVQLCSAICFSAYKFTSNYETSKCDQCETMFRKLNDDFVEHVIHYGGNVKRFCCAACQNVFVMQTRDIVPCAWCKVRKYNFDMIEQYDSASSIKHFCSISCLNQRPHDSSYQQQPATTTAAAPAPSMPIIQSVSSLAGAGQPPAQADRLPTHPIAQAQLPPPPAQVQIQTKTVTMTMKETLVKLPDVKEMCNKAVMTKPLMVSKGAACRPHPCHKGTQTDFPSVPAIVPVVVPMYMPVPMAMYAKPYPVPVPVPIPVPVPVFIPTSRNTFAGVMKHIKKIRSKVPADPFEAEMLDMAGALASKKEEEEEDGSEDSVAGDLDGRSDDGANVKVARYIRTSVEDLESDIKADRVVPKPLPVVSADPFLTSPTTLKPASQRNSNKRRYSGKDDSGDEGVDECAWQPNDCQTRRASTRRRTKRNRHENSTENSSAVAVTTVTQAPKERPDAKHHLKFTYGVNAWKHWVVGKNAELEKARAQGKYVKNFETDLLKLRADELNYTLCMFVKEVRKPNGDSYAADSVLYLAYGIQEYLFENGRIDNIFTDMYYEPFTSALYEVVKNFKLPMNELGYYVTRIEEEHLWEAKQLGAHSPQVLLNTLVYLKSKYFMLSTAEDHQKLSFTHIVKHWKKKDGGGQKSVVLRYYPPAKKGQRSDERKCYEEHENIDNSLRCPVKLYEFYLSKCPESSKTRNDLFYLMPERSCVPDSPVWYSNLVLPLHQLDKMLQRNLMVREVQEHMLADGCSS